jgi:hypothetical protein
MKANKVTIKIEVETLSIDAVPAKIYQMIHELHENEVTSGRLTSDDGDSISWTTIIKPVEF